MNLIRIVVRHIIDLLRISEDSTDHFNARWIILDWTIQQSHSVSVQICKYFVNLTKIPTNIKRVRLYKQIQYADIRFTSSNTSFSNRRNSRWSGWVTVKIPSFSSYVTVPCGLKLSIWFLNFVLINIINSGLMFLLAVALQQHSECI